MKINIGRRVLVALVVAVVAVVGIGAGAYALLGGDDETRERGTCAGASHELTVESENGGLEASFELQGDQVGQTWDVTLEQDGTTLVEGERQTDEDAELDVDAYADDTAGADEFTVTFAPSGASETCTSSVTHD
ncbi:MAG: hypothetical protein ABWX84_09100 [Nocardioides sp.]